VCASFRCDMRLKFVKTPDVFDHPIIPTPGAFTNVRTLVLLNLDGCSCPPQTPIVKRSAVRS
jgi:hypothetical protein